MRQPPGGVQEDGRAQEPAGPEGPEGQDPGMEDLEGGGLVAEYTGSFWAAVKDGTVPTPELLDWNEWQHWRAAAGKLPKGTRGPAEGRREAALWREAMLRYHGSGWEAALRPLRKHKNAVLKAQREVRQLFPVARSARGTSAGTAPASATMLRRANLLLLDLEDYQEDFGSIAYLCNFGSELYPDIFTKAFCAQTKMKFTLMSGAYAMLAAEREDPSDRAEHDRDDPGVGAVLVQMFVDRFKQETDPSYFSPKMGAAYEAFDELLATYDQPGAARLLTANRRALAAAQAEVEEPERDRFSSVPVAAATPAARGPTAAREPVLREGGARVAALGRAPKRAPDSKFLEEDPFWIKRRPLEGAGRSSRSPPD